MTALAVKQPPPFPQHKIPDLSLEKRGFERRRKCGQSEAKAQHWAPHQTARSAPHCQDNLEKTCPQLLPQPQEGLTSHSLTHCPAPDTALYVTASSHGGGGGGGVGGGLGVSSTSERRQKVSRFLLFMSLFVFSSAEASIFPSLLCACGREKEDKGRAHMEVQVKINTPDLSWTEFHPNCRADSHSILMHLHPPQNTHGHYYNSTALWLTETYRASMENCSQRGAAGAQKCLERR